MSLLQCMPSNTLFDMEAVTDRKIAEQIREIKDSQLKEWHRLVFSGEFADKLANISYPE